MEGEGGGIVILIDTISNLQGSEPDRFFRWHRAEGFQQGEV